MLLPFVSTSTRSNFGQSIVFFKKFVTVLFFYTELGAVTISSWLRCGRRRRRAQLVELETATAVGTPAETMGKTTSAEKRTPIDH